MFPPEEFPRGDPPDTLRTVFLQSVKLPGIYGERTLKCINGILKFYTASWAPTGF